MKPWLFHRFGFIASIFGPVAVTFFCFFLFVLPLSSVQSPTTPAGTAGYWRRGPATHSCNGDVSGQRVMLSAKRLRVIIL